MSDESWHTGQLEGWIQRLKSGDESARNELLNCAYDRMVRLTRKMLRSYPRVHRWEETSDVMQNAALRLHRSLAEVHPANVIEFLRLAALNIRRELLDLAKHYYGPEGQGANYASQERNPDSSGSNWMERNAGDAGDDPGQLAAWTEFHRQVDQLPDEEHEIFDLLWYQGLTQAEAGALLNISERTVKRRWQSARLLLHDRLKGQLPDLD
jgi:RNA polymerase sigma-70 factor (ECF subfamily)